MVSVDEEEEEVEQENRRRRRRRRKRSIRRMRRRWDISDEGLEACCTEYVQNLEILTTAC